MFDFLLDHAYKNVWCTPEQDNQSILKLAKITPVGGVKRQFKVLFNYLTLPDQTSTWHLYQIGQVHPIVLGLFPKKGVWVNFKEACNTQKMICDIYTTDGVQLPRFETYYINTNDRNLIVAVKRINKIPFSFNNDDIFLRLYSNHFFETQRAHNTLDFIHTNGSVITSEQDILDLQQEYNDYSSANGQTYCFVNGLKVDSIDLLTTKIGDHAEFVYDSSIYKVVDFKLSDLLSFDSVLDLKRKYLLHYNGSGSGTIDFQDDVDVFILRDKGNNRHSGLFYHKNNPDAFRSLTHRDYSVCVSYMNTYVDKIKSFESVETPIQNDELYIRLHIRKSGYERSLVFENNRIHELYKLSDQDIVRAMLGIDSTVTNWRAEVLENSDYTRIMRSFAPDISNQIVEQAYGYNAISYISGMTPSKTVTQSSNKVVDVPYILQKGCTAYEYNTDGLMTGYYYHPFGSQYVCSSNSTDLVELIAGKGELLLNEEYGFTSTPYVKELDFRVYQCKLKNGLPDNQWIDVTDFPNKYSVDNNRILWLDQNPVNYPMVRFNSSFLCYDTVVNLVNGELKITLTHLQKRNNKISNWIMQVPMGELDVFLNGRSLIKDLDFTYKAPFIYILNKKYLDDALNEPQNIHIRFTGFCKPNFELNERNDTGFIEHGVLSNNHKFNIRDDKVLRITIDGSLKTREDLVFSELHSGVSMLNPTNGLPYQIKDIVVPTRDLTTSDTYTLRHRSEQIDDIVSDYLSYKIPQPPRPALSAIPNRYPVFSPFICKLLFDLREGKLVLQNKIYKKQEIIEVCKDYQYLLQFDPTQEERKLNSSYVIIHPHPLNETLLLTLNSYRFLDAVVHLYCNNLISLSPFVQIEP